MEVDLKRAANLTGSTVTISGKDDVSAGVNAGLLYKPTQKTRIGLHYRSGTVSYTHLDVYKRQPSGGGFDRAVVIVRP